LTPSFSALWLDQTPSILPWAFAHQTLISGSVPA